MSDGRIACRAAQDRRPSAGPSELVPGATRAPQGPTSGRVTRAAVEALHPSPAPVLQPFLPENHPSNSHTTLSNGVPDLLRSFPITRFRGNQCHLAGYSPPAGQHAGRKNSDNLPRCSPAAGLSARGSARRAAQDRRPSAGPPELVPGASHAPQGPTSGRVTCAAVRAPPLTPAPVLRRFAPRVTTLTSLDFSPVRLAYCARVLSPASGAISATSRVSLHKRVNM